MGLSDIVPEEIAEDEEEIEKQYPVGEVESRKKVENLTMSDEWWQRSITAHHPYLLTLDARNRTTEELKCMLELLDTVILNEIDGMEVSSQQKTQAESAREDVLEALRD